jgi:nitroimidazol reductase NimA-like FMN-containing flavoprotein (pyridoxamine 5'-phosphate oxidase superfamily)
MPKPIEPVPNSAECERIITSFDVGVLVMSQGGAPYAVPMNHVYHQGALYFHCAPTGRKLDAIRANPRVCYVVNNDLGAGERKGMGGLTCHVAWESVIACGAARVLEDPEELSQAFLIFGRRFRPDFEVTERALETTRAIVIRVESMTARYEPGNDQEVQYWSWSPSGP